MATNRIGVLMVVCLVAAQISVTQVGASAQTAHSPRVGAIEGLLLPRSVPMRMHTFEDRLIEVERLNGDVEIARGICATDSGLVTTFGLARRSTQLREVRRISIRGDSLKDGALIGGAFGAVIGGWFGCDTCSTRAQGIVGGMAAYGGLGVLIDYLHRGRTTIPNARIAC